MIKLEKFHGIHNHETCVIIGNGPSLDETPLEELSKLYPTFGSNMIFRKPFTPTYYCIIDELMLKACLPLPDDFRPTLFLRAEAMIHNNNPIYPIVSAGFSLNIPNFVIMGGTVTYVMMQLAFYMGFDTVLLVGVDHRYPKTGDCEPGTNFVSEGNDPDHFTPADGEPYFENKKRFNNPELDGTRIAYETANKLFIEQERKIINLTPNTALDVFEKGNIEEWL